MTVGATKYPIALTVIKFDRSHDTKVLKEYSDGGVKAGGMHLERPVLRSRML